MIALTVALGLRLPCLKASGFNSGLGSSGVRVRFMASAGRRSDELQGRVWIRSPVFREGRVHLRALAQGWHGFGPSELRVADVIVWSEGRGPH